MREGDREGGRGWRERREGGWGEEGGEGGREMRGWSEGGSWEGAGREGGEGRGREGWRDDCYTYSNDTTIFK